MFFILGLEKSSGVLDNRTAHVDRPWTASQAAIMQPLNAAFVTAFSLLLRLESFKWLKLAGIGVAAIGVIIISGGAMMFEVCLTPFSVR